MGINVNQQYEIILLHFFFFFEIILSIYIDQLIAS